MGVNVVGMNMEENPLKEYLTSEGLTTLDYVDTKFKGNDLLQNDDNC